MYFVPCNSRQEFISIVSLLDSKHILEHLASHVAASKKVHFLSLNKPESCKLVDTHLSDNSKWVQQAGSVILQMPMIFQKSTGWLHLFKDIW